MESREILNECKLQLEYLNDKFGETGTTNALLAKINSLPPSKEVVSDEEIRKEAIVNDVLQIDGFIDGAKWMRSHLSNVKEGDYYKRKFEALSDWLLKFRKRAKDEMLLIEIESVLMSNPPLLVSPSTETDKSEAVEFAEWVGRNYSMVAGSEICKWVSLSEEILAHGSLKYYDKLILEHGKTTPELYSLFKQSKK